MSTDCTDLVSISELHRRLKAEGDPINRSSLSRYVTRYADALNPVVRGRDTLVSFETVRAHRAENINIESRPPGRGDYGSQKIGAAAKARKEEADAGLRELELAKARERLTDRAEVATAAREAIALAGGAFDLAAPEIAARAEKEDGIEQRVTLKILRRYREAGWEEFRRALTKALDGEPETNPD